MLCLSAVKNFEKYSRYQVDGSSRIQRGLFVNYESLPGIIGQVILPLTGFQPSSSWLFRMQTESTNYSKGKSKTKVFSSDSSDKEIRATEEIKKYSEIILDQTYQKIEILSSEAFINLGLQSFLLNNKVNWNSFAAIPDTAAEFSKILYTSYRLDDPTDLTNSNQHSNFVKIPYVPWSPFSNSHSSVPYEVFYRNHFFVTRESNMNAYFLPFYSLFILDLYIFDSCFRYLL